MFESPLISVLPGFIDVISYVRAYFSAYVHAFFRFLKLVIYIEGITMIYELNKTKTKTKEKQNNLD